MAMGRHSGWPHWLMALCLLVIISGCSQIEPRTGTRVTFGLAPGRALDREEVREVSSYLKARAREVLRIEKPRVESVGRDTLVLLLPGKSIRREDVAKLLGRTSLEIYYLDQVATSEHPDRPWQLRPPKKEGAAYLFLGPEGAYIDSRQDREDLLKEVVGYPQAKPVLTGEDVMPTASQRQVSSGWAVLVRFTEEGAKRFRQFTRVHRGEYLAVFYNGSLISAGIVQEPVKGEEVFLTSFWSLAEAKAAVRHINTGKLPVQVKIQSVEHY